MFLSTGSSDSLHFSKSSAFNEKKATSEAETIAERKSNMAMAIKPDSKKGSGVPDSKSTSSVLLGGSSKEVGVSKI